MPRPLRVFVEGGIYPDHLLLAFAESVEEIDAVVASTPAEEAELVIENV